MSGVSEAALAPALWGKVALVVTAAALAAFGVAFKGKQKPGAIGGAISAPKAFWLSFAIYLWFVVCPVVGLGAGGVVDVAVTRPLLWVGASMWARGLVEIVMLYGTKNWRPPYGIAHDVITIGVLLAGTGLGFADGLRGDASPLTVAVIGLQVVVLASLVLEIVHARTFFAVVGAQTMGDAGVWFADETDPRFIAINRRTRIGNVALGVPTAAFVVEWVLA